MTSQQDRGIGKTVLLRPDECTCNVFKFNASPNDQGAGRDCRFKSAEDEVTPSPTERDPVEYDALATLQLLTLGQGGNITAGSITVSAETYRGDPDKNLNTKMKIWNCVSISTLRVFYWDRWK